MRPQEIMKEKMPNLDPNTVSVKAKPKENTEQVILKHWHIDSDPLRIFFILQIGFWTRVNELCKKDKAMFKIWFSSRPLYRALPPLSPLCWTLSTGVG